MRFLIVDDDDEAVEQSVLRAEEVHIDAIGIVSKNWHVYGTVSDDRISDTIAKHYNTTHIFDHKPIEVIFINFSQSREESPESHQARAEEWLKWASGACSDLAKIRFFSISSYPVGSQIKNIGDSVEDMIRKMREEIRRKQDSEDLLKIPGCHV